MTKAPTTRPVWHGPAGLKKLLVPIGLLAPHPSNPRKHDLPAIMQSLKQLGQQKPIVVVPPGRVHPEFQTIVAGHGTTFAARELGWSHVAAVESDLEDVDIERFVLADNRTSDRAGYDDEVLARLLGEVQERGGLDGTGYSRDDLDALLRDLQQRKRTRDPDDTPEPPKKPQSKRGEVYELGPHRVMCGDATSAGDVDELMGGVRSDLVFTSPPYKDVREYGTTDLDVSHLASFLPAWRDRADLFAVNLGVLRKDGAVDPYWDVYIATAAECGLRLLAWNVWDRQEAGTIGQATAMFAIEHEFVFVFGQKARKLQRTIPNKGAGDAAGLTVRQRDGSVEPTTGPAHIGSHRQLGSVYRCPPHKGPSQGDHPAVFPVSFPVAYLEAATRRGDVVADPFAGSGTTLIAAEMTGRRACVMELDPVYCDVIRQRYADYTEQPEFAPVA